MQARAELCLAGAAATSAHRAAGRAAMLVGGAHALSRFAPARPSGEALLAASCGRRYLHDKPYRVHQLPRLRPVRSWHQFAPFVSGVKFRFDPAMDGTTGVK